MTKHTRCLEGTKLQWGPSDLCPTGYLDAGRQLPGNTWGFLFENCSLYYYLSSHCKRQGEKRQGEGESLDKLKTFMGEKKKLNKWEKNE